MGLDVRTYGNIKLAENDEDADFTAFVIDEDWIDDIITTVRYQFKKL